MKNFTAVIERDADTGLYVGWVPGFPGAHSQGETLDELRSNLQEVIEMLLEGGDPDSKACSSGLRLSKWRSPWRSRPNQAAAERVRAWTEGLEGATAPTEEAMTDTKYPAGWDEERVKRVLAHYEQQTDEEAVAEDEAAYESTTHTAMEVPVDLVPAVRELLAKRRAG